MQQVLSRRRLVTHHAHGGAQTGARVEPMSIQRPVLGVPVLPLPLGKPGQRHGCKQRGHTGRRDAKRGRPLQLENSEPSGTQVMYSEDLCQVPFSQV